MPRRDEYPEKLTHLEIIELFRSGKYLVDPDRGQVLSGRTKKQLYTYTGGWKAGQGPINPEAGSLWLHLFATPKIRAIQVSHCVWLFKTGVPIPPGFQIHHRDLDQRNNSWRNLFCLFHMDHSKLHRNNGEVDDLIDNGEETPF